VELGTRSLSFPSQSLNSWSLTDLTVGLSLHQSRKPWLEVVTIFASTAPDFDYLRISGRP
jgi:hypothetical protein